MKADSEQAAISDIEDISVQEGSIEDAGDDMSGNTVEQSGSLKRSDGTLPDGHEGGCELPMMMWGPLRNSALITGDGYTFNPADGKLTVSSNEGAANWRTDANIAAKDADRYKAIQSVEFNANVTEIKESAFQNCTSLTGSLNLPEGLQSIGSYAFWSCFGLTEVSLPASLQSIERDAFYACTSLKAFSVVKGNPCFSTKDGVLYNKDMTTLLNYALGKGDTAFAVPEGVTTIGYHAFDSAVNLTGVTFPNSLGIIDEKAFNFCKNLTSAAFLDNLQTIGNGAFSNCYKLGNVTFPKDLSAIGSNAFAYCYALASVDFPSSLRTIGNGAFSSCTILESVTFPNSLQSIGDRAFQGCRKLNALTFQTDAPPTIGSNAFDSISYTGSITYPAGASGYTGAWRNGIGLSDWTLTEQGMGSVEPYPVLTVEFNNNGNGGMNETDNDMKDAVETALGSWDKTKFTTIEITGNATEITDWNWAYLMELYRSDRDWSALTILDLSGMDRLVRVANRKIGSMGLSITTVHLPDNLQTIGNYTFWDCRNLVLTSLPANLQNIGDYAFTGCTGVKIADLPSGLKTIGTSAFASSGLTCTSLPGTLTTIGEYAFSFCAGLNTATLPASLTHMGENPFTGCANLTSIHVEAGNQAFESQDGVVYTKGKGTLLICPSAGQGQTFTVPDMVTTIGVYAFSFHKGLDSVTLPANLDAINFRAFYDCSDLSSLVFLGDTPPSALGGSAFDQVSSSGTITYPAGSGGYTEEWKNEILKLTGWTRTPAYQLTVTNGTDETNAALYPENTQVRITADAAPTGKAFDKWTTSNGGTFTDADSPATTFIMPAANVTVTATYHTHKHEGIPVPVYTVDFRTMGGSSINPMAVSSGNVIPKPDDPVREFYEFTGWYREQTLETAWDLEKDRITGDMTLYAGWKPYTPDTPVITKVTNGVRAVRVTWKKIPKVTGYVVYGYTGDAEDFDTRVVVPRASNVTCLLTNLTPGTSKRYVVRAYKHLEGKNHYGKPSKEALTVTKPSAAVIQSAAQYRDQQKIRVTLKGARGAVGYAYYVTNKDGSSKLLSAKGPKNPYNMWRNVKKGVNYIKAWPYVLDSEGKTVYGNPSKIVKVTVK